MGVPPFSTARGLLLDLNGVFFEDERALPGAAAALAALRQSSVAVRFTTNTTTRTRAELAQKLHEMGLAIDEQELVTPVQAAVHHLRSLGSPKVHLLLRDNLKPAFAEFAHEPSRPDVIVVGDIGDRWNFQIVNHLFQMMMYGAELVALHRGRYWQKESELRVDIGAFVAGLEYATGHDALVIGKPSPTFFQMAVDELGCRPAEALMIGDDIEGDIRGAQSAGLRAAIVRTGKFRSALVESSGVRPDATLTSIADLPSHLS